MSVVHCSVDFNKLNDDDDEKTGIDSAGMTCCSKPFQALTAATRKAR